MTLSRWSAYDFNIVKIKLRYHHGALREALTDAAAHLLAEFGPSGVSLRETARRAGVSQAAPYHYFPSKSALLTAVGEAGFRALDELQAAAFVRASDDAAARVAALVTTYLRFAIERPHYFAAMFRGHGSRPPFSSEAAVRVTERLVEAVRAARAAAGHEDLDPAAIATLIWAVPHGLATLYVDGPIARDLTPVLLEQLARAAIEPLVAIPPHDVHGDWAV